MSDQKKLDIAKIQEYLQSKCPYAYLKEGIGLNLGENGQIRGNSDAVYCKIVKEQTVLYTTNASGNKSGIFVIAEDQKCMHYPSTSDCLVKIAWKS